MRRLHLLLTVAPLVALFLTHSVRAQWTPGVGTAVCTADSNQFRVVACPDGNGGVIIAWQDSRNGQMDPYLPAGSDVYAQRLNAAGIAQWTTNGVGVCTHTYGQLEPSIMADGNGGAFVAWYDYRNGNADLYAQRINATGQPQWTVNGVSIASTADDEFRPSLVPDGVGGAIIMYYHSFTSGQSESIAFVQRINGSGVAQWTAGGVWIRAGWSSAIADGTGGAIIASAPYIYPYNDIYAQRVNAQGTKQWNLPNGSAVCTDYYDQSWPITTSDGAGGAIVAWIDSRPGGGVYGQRVNGSGQPQWATNGISIGLTGSPTSIIPDNQGGAIVLWEDTRSGFDNRDIYGQRVNGSGIGLWTPGGQPLCMASGNQYNPRATSDGAGGALVSWTDFRTGIDFDLYAQRINSSGTIEWANDGVLLAGGSGDQHNVAPISGGELGTIVPYINDPSGNQDLWGDGTDDVYAQLVTTDGTIPTAVRDTPLASTVVLSPNYPNPFSKVTSLDVSLHHNSSAHADVFDAAGRRVRSIQLGVLSSGLSRLVFDGLDGTGHALPSGVYFYRLTAGGQTATRKIVLQY